MNTELILYLVVSQPIKKTRRYGSVHFSVVVVDNNNNNNNNNNINNNNNNLSTQRLFVKSPQALHMNKKWKIAIKNKIKLKQNLKNLGPIFNISYKEVCLSFTQQ